MSKDTIELNFKAGTFKELISQAMLAALGSGWLRARLSLSSLQEVFYATPATTRWRRWCKH